MRDYIAALDEWGLVIRVPRVDQDAYEATALMYRARQEHGMRGAPAFVFEEIKINGEVDQRGRSLSMKAGIVLENVWLTI